MPGSRPGIAFHEDVLRGGSPLADAVDSSLVKLMISQLGVGLSAVAGVANLGHEAVVHIVVLIVGVEHNLGVVLELCGHGLPPRLEAGGVGDHLVVVPPYTPGVRPHAISLGSCGIVPKLWGSTMAYAPLSQLISHAGSVFAPFALLLTSR